MGNPTTFAGPVLYSGKLNKSSPFKDLPVSINPDFYQVFEDYLGKNVNTNELTFTPIAAGVHDIYDTTLIGTQADGNENTLRGVSYIISDESDPTIDNSGGILGTNSLFQPGLANVPCVAEAKISLTQPRQCDFFFGFRVYPYPTNPGIETWKVGFIIEGADASQELQAYSRIGSVINKVGTGRYMAVGDGSFGDKILSVRTFAPRTGFPVVQFYVNRNLVFTMSYPNGTVPNQITQNAIYNVTLEHTKTSELSDSQTIKLVGAGGVVGSDVLSTDTLLTFETPYGFQEPDTLYPDRTFDLSGLYQGQTFRIAGSAEDIKIVGGINPFINPLTTTVERGVNGTTPVDYTYSPTANFIESSTGAMFIDYILAASSRYAGGGYRTGPGYLINRTPTT